MDTPQSRRTWLKTVSMSLLPWPTLLLSQSAQASVNATVRKQLAYQDTPQGTYSCANCLDFLPGKTDKDLGGCTKIPNDTEISPNAYCAAWNTM